MIFCLVCFVFLQSSSLFGPSSVFSSLPPYELVPRRPQRVHLRGGDSRAGLLVAEHQVRAPAECEGLQRQVAHPAEQAN